MSKNVISFPGLGIGEFSVDPVAFRIGDWPVAWYGVIITCGFLCAFLYAFYRAKREKFSTDHLTDYLLFGMVFGVIGARLYYVLTKLDSYIVEGNIGKTLYNMVAVWEGGLAIYGGIIGGVLTVFVISRMKRQSFLQVCDLIIPGVALAQAIGRWGNFINAEAHGGVTELPWRMGIRTPMMLETVYVHPTFLYESLWNLLGFFLLHFLVTPRRKYYGQNLLCYAVWYGFGRMFIEGLRTDSLYIPGTQIRISQLIAVLSVLICGSLLIYFAVTGRKSKGIKKHAKKKPSGLAAAVATAIPNDDKEAEAETEAEPQTEIKTAGQAPDTPPSPGEQENTNGTDH